MQTREREAARALGTLPLMPKARSRARGALVRPWTEELGASWDGAIRGSPLLRAALRRGVLDETGREVLTSSATLLCNLSNFYGMISLALLESTINIAPPLASPAELVTVQWEMAELLSVVLLDPPRAQRQTHRQRSSSPCSWRWPS